MFRRFLSSACVRKSSLRLMRHAPPNTPLLSADLWQLPRIRRNLLEPSSSRSYVEWLCDGGTSDEVTARLLSRVLVPLVYDIGVPILLEGLVEALVPAMVCRDDVTCVRSTQSKVLVSDSVSGGSWVFDRDTSSWHVIETESSEDHINAPPPDATLVDNDRLTAYRSELRQLIKSPNCPLLILPGSDDDEYVVPRSLEFFLRRFYPCIRKDATKEAMHVAQSAGWVGFAWSAFSSQMVVEAYLDHVHRISDGAFLSFVAGEDGILNVSRQSHDYVLASTNELTRLSTEPSDDSLSQKQQVTPRATAGDGDFVATLSNSLELTRLYTEIVVPQSTRMQARGLHSFVAYLRLERTLVSGLDAPMSAFDLIALATRLSTPSFVLASLAKCSIKRSKTPAATPIPVWCFPIFAGYFVTGDDLIGISDTHVHAATKTILSYDTSEENSDTLINACRDLKKAIWEAHPFLADIHHHVTLCTFRFFQKHEQLHRALKKSIVADSDARVRASRIKEIMGNLRNALTELEYCINAHLIKIDTMPATPGRVLPTEDPEEEKQRKALILFQYWYVDWLATVSDHRL